jgi:hypothetical protein
LRTASCKPWPRVDSKAHPISAELVGLSRERVGESFGTDE